MTNEKCARSQPGAEDESQRGGAPEASAAGVPLLTNKRGELEWRWLVEQVGQVKALAALAAVVQAGQRGYPLNAARRLGLRLPAADHLARLYPLTRAFIVDSPKSGNQNDAFAHSKGIRRLL